MLTPTPVPFDAVTGTGLTVGWIVIIVGIVAGIYIACGMAFKKDKTDYDDRFHDMRK